MVPVSEVLSAYAVLLDRTATAERAPHIEVPAGVHVENVAGVVEWVLGADRGVTCVVLAVGGTVIGVTSRAHLVETFGRPHVRSFGDADRATQPGESTRYRPVAFRCAQCGHITYTAFFDERYRPTCQTTGHGEMEPV
jgi:hypothetical protein